MATMKSKMTVAPAGGNTKEKDVPKGNTEIQIKEEPANMDEYLKSSNTFLQVHAKTHVSAASSSNVSYSTSATKLSTSGKTASTQAPGPAAAAAATPKPVAGAVTRLQGQNLRTEVASKVVPTPIAAKTPVAGVKDNNSSLTAKQKLTVPVLAANGKSASGNLKSTTALTNLGGNILQDSSLSADGAKSVVATSKSTGAVSMDPKARLTPGQKDSNAVNNPRKASPNVSAQKDGSCSQVEIRSLTLLTSSKAVGSSAPQKSTPLPGTPKTMPLKGVPLKKIQEAKAVVCPPTSASGATGKQSLIEAVSDTTHSLNNAAQDRPLHCRQTSQSKTGPVAATCPDATNRSGHNTEEYAASYESSSLHNRQVLAQQGTTTDNTPADNNSSVNNDNGTEDLEITIKIEPPDDYPSSATITAAHLAVQEGGNDNATQSSKQALSSPPEAAQIQALHAGNAADTTCSRDTGSVSSGVKTSLTATSAKQAIFAVAKAGSSVLTSSATGSRLSDVSKPVSGPKLGSAASSKPTADSSASSDVKKSSAPAATTASAAGLVHLPTNEIDLSIVKTEPMDEEEEADRSVPLETQPESVIQTSNTQTSGKETLADNSQIVDSVAAELHTVMGLSLLPESAAEQVSCATSELPDVMGNASPVATSFAAAQPDTLMPILRVPQVDSRTCDDKILDSSKNLESSETAAGKSPSDIMAVSNDLRDSTREQDHGAGEMAVTSESLYVEPNFPSDYTAEVSGSTEDILAKKPEAGVNDAQRNSGAGEASVSTEFQLHIQPSFTSDNIAGLADSTEDMSTSEPEIDANNTVGNSVAAAREGPDSILTADAHATVLSSDVDGCVPSGDLSLKSQFSGLRIQTPKAVEEPTIELNRNEDVVGRCRVEASAMECSVVGAEKDKIHQTMTVPTPLSSKNSKGKQCEQPVETFLDAVGLNSSTGFGGAQLEKDVVKRVIRLKKQDKNKRHVEDKSKSKPVFPPAKRSRLLTPVSGKENAGLTGMQSKSDRKKSSSRRILRKKILTPCTSQRPSSERKNLKKNPIGEVSDDLWMETSSFLDEDLRSEPESYEPDLPFETRNYKQQTDLRAVEKGNLHGSSKLSKSFMNQTKRGRIFRKEPNMRYRSRRHIRFPFLSQFAKHSVDRCTWDWASCQVEDISASQRQDLLSDLNSVYLGRQPRFLLKPMGHLDGLSLETQLESQLLDFHTVRTIFLEVARDWVRKKPLHLLMTGQLKLEPRTYMPPKRTSKTNITFENCQKAFSRDICYILAEICDLGESEDSLFALPDGVSQFTANRVFRKVKQYLRNYVERLLRMVVVDSDSVNCRLFCKENKRSISSKLKPKQILKESSLAQMHVCEKILSTEEPPVFPEVDGGEKNESTLNDGATHEKLLREPSKQLSVELSLPVQNSLNAAFDLFSKEAEGICQGASETGVVADGIVANGEVRTVIDSSKLYSPTRPTDLEEFEIDVPGSLDVAETVATETVSKNTARLPDEASHVISVDVIGKPVSCGEVSPAEKAVYPKVARVEEAEDGEIENGVDQDESVTGSDFEGKGHGKKLRSLVARKTKEATPMHSLKRKKRTKASKEKKTKRKKDKHRSESHLNLEKDRGRKKKKFKISEEDKVESKRRVSSLEIHEVSRAEPARICLASTSDPVYFDSYTSVVEDVLSSTPLSNFEDNFDPLLPSSRHYRNPFRLSWPVIEYFISKNVDVISKLIGIIPNGNAFRTQLLKPQNSFLWSLVLAVFGATTRFQTEVKNTSEAEETGQNILYQNLKSVGDDQMELGSTVEDGVKKSSVKGNNPLMQAFRQVVEAKRRLSKDSHKSKPVSSVAKLSAELAALRAAPKSAKPLYKPTTNIEAQQTLQMSDPIGSRLQDTIEQSAQLATEALSQFYNELKMLLNELNDGSKECLTVASDLPQIKLPTAGSHLRGLSSLVSSLYENYERLSKEAEETVFSQPLTEMDECVIIEDTNIQTDNRLDEASNGVNVDLQTGDVNQPADDTVEAGKFSGAPGKNGQHLSDLLGEGTNLMLCPEIPLPKESESAAAKAIPFAAEKETTKVKDMEEIGLSSVPAMPATNDRQYISSFPPINAIKKKAKATPQAPRMVFSKLIGPSLEERLGSASSITVTSPLVTPHPQVSGEQPPSVSATSSLQLSSTVAPSSMTLTPEVSVSIDEAQDGAKTNQSSSAQTTGLSTTVGKSDSMPSSSNPVSCEGLPASVKTLHSQETPSIEKQKLTISSVSSNAAVVKPVSTVISVTAPSSSATVASTSSAPAAVTISSPGLATGSQAPLPSASANESSLSATFPPIPPEKPCSKNISVQPPLPLGEADMLPPPMPPMTLSEMSTSGSNTSVTKSSSSSAYYSSYYSGLSSSSQSQGFSALPGGYAAYAGGTVDPTQSLVSPWMYDQNMYAASNQTPMLDPSLMGYPPPLHSDPMSFYLHPTNQPPPYLPPAPTGQLFPAYPSSQPVLSVPSSNLPYSQTVSQIPSAFSVPPPNLPPPSLPPPSIPPPTIPPPSIPPPSIFPPTAPFPTSMPPPVVTPYNMYGPQWTPDVSSNSNPYLSSDYYSQPPSSTSLSTMPSSSAFVSVPPPVLDGQQSSLPPESLSSIHDMVKYPPPAVPGSSVLNSNIPDSLSEPTKPDHQTDLSSKKDQSSQFSSQPNDTFDYAAPSFKNRSISSSNENKCGGQEQSQQFETSNYGSYAKQTNQQSNRVLEFSESENGFGLENQPWDSCNPPRDSMSGLYESENRSVEDSWPSQSRQLTVEEGPPGRQQRSTGPLPQKQQQREASANNQARKLPHEDSLQGQSSHQEQPPGSQIRQPGANYPDQRHAVPRRLQPGPEPRQSAPLLRPRGPLLRQPGLEPRQPVPLPRQPIPLQRQPGLESRQPCSVQRQPGPLLRPSAAQQRQPGQCLRQPGPTEQKQEGSQRRPGLQPRLTNPAGQEQKLLGSQPRPTSPQSRPSGLDQIQGSRGPERKALGPPAAGHQAGPGSVTPLMAVPVRRSLEGTANQSARPDRPGHVTPQGPLSNTRFFVFNTDRPACETAERLLLCSGAQKFDPYNINALRVMPEIRCLLLVHKDDLKHVQRIPSLLRLKRDLRVSFVTFGDASDIQQKRLVAFFPRAGTMIMDLTALLACRSDVLDGMCQFMTHQTLEKRTSWKLMLPSHVFSAIDFLKYKYEDEPEEHVRLAEVSQILATYKTSGIVEFLPEIPYRGQPRTTVEYQACCVALQVNRLGSYRHFLFVTDMPRNHPDANLFLNNGIDILSIPEFMRCFVSRQVEHEPKLHPPYITRVTMSRYHDATISVGTESIAI